MGILHGYRVSIWDNENILELVMDVQVCQYTEFINCEFMNT